jgi:hypothetical protein
MFFRILQIYFEKKFQSFFRGKSFDFK